MFSRERVLTALDHREPDRVPFDLGSTGSSGIHTKAYLDLLRRLGIEEEPPDILILAEQLATPSEKVLQTLKVDVRGFWPNSPLGWVEEIRDAGDYFETIDEFRVKLAMPKKGGLYYDIVGSPLAGPISDKAVDDFEWPDMSNPERVRGIRSEIEKALAGSGAAIVFNTFHVGIFELGEWVRGFKDYYADIARNPALIEHMIDIFTDMRIGFWELVLNNLGDLIDVVVENDDLGIQNGLMISPSSYRTLVKPKHKRIFSFIKKKAPHVRIQLHSCGSIYDLIPDLIEVGIDILNPVQVGAAKMDTNRLKREFGEELTFWGGGVDTQRILPFGTQSEVRDEVRRRIEDLAPQGGFVFSTVHNIQPGVPVENVIAMLEALEEYGVY